MSKRAIRRHHQDRILTKARRRLRIQGWDLFNGFEQTVRRRANNFVVCSCWMCGNPRRHYGELTRKEIQANLDLGVEEYHAPHHTGGISF